MYFSLKCSCIKDLSNLNSLIGIENTTSPEVVLNKLLVFEFCAVIFSIGASEKKLTKDFSKEYF
jgi:hypothetical protein